MSEQVVGFFLSFFGQLYCGKFVQVNNFQSFKNCSVKTEHTYILLS